MLPGMLVAVVAHPPRFGGKVRSFDASAAKAVKGVVDVVEIPRGVAVVAKSTWAAIKGRRALEVEWDESAAETRGSQELLEHYRAALDASRRGVGAQRRRCRQARSPGLRACSRRSSSFPISRMPRSSR